MSKNAKPTNPSAANQLLIGLAVQSDEVYLPRLGSRALARIAARQMIAIR